jgi:hypothetical protein
VNRTRAESRRRACTVVALLASFALGASATGNAEAGILWAGDYETGNLNQWAGAQAVPGGAAVTTAPLRSGVYAARFVVRPGDDPIGSTGERAELLAWTGETAGVESWWAWSTYFGDDFEPAPNTQWNIFTQWHNSGTTGQSNAHFEVNTSTTPWTLQLRKFGGELIANQVVFTLAPFERNRWFDFVFHVRWAPDDTGFVEVWLDGQLVVPLTYTPTSYFGQGVYLKQGFYRAESSGTSVVYHDGMRRGQSYSDLVDSSPSTPPPSSPPPPETPIVAPSEPFQIAFVGRPHLLRGKRLRVRARSATEAWTTISVRGPRGRLLARRWAQAGADGNLSASLRVRRWHGQRFVVVTIAAGGTRATATVRRSRR